MTYRSNNTSMMLEDVKVEKQVDGGSTAGSYISNSGLSSNKELRHQSTAERESLARIK